MRTKALLGLAALAASALTVAAQGNVYSLNIVGYVNVTAPAGYSMMANPLSAGVTNGANEVQTTWADGATIIKFVSGLYQYTAYDAGGAFWYDATGTPTGAPTIAPGTGFFYFNPGSTAQTITFVGQVVPNPGQTNSFPLPAGYSLVGSPMPVASGALGTSATTGNPPVPGAFNMPLADGTTVIPFVSGLYQYYALDAGGHFWYDATGTATTAPQIAVGQGFFHFNPLAGAENWLQALP